MSTDALYSSRLREIYERNGIGKASFDCKKLGDCIKAAQPRLINAKGAEAHIGSCYGEVLRIVVVSLDTGHCAQDLVERRSAIEGLSKPNPHMKGTVATLRALFGEAVEPNSVLRHYAMINAAKCAANDGRADKLPDTIYQYCRGYALQELSALEPQLVVTQGKDSRRVLPMTRLIETRELESVLVDFQAAPPIAKLSLHSIGRQYLRVWNMVSGPVLVVETPHPSARQGQWKVFEQLGLPSVAFLARRLIGNLMPERSPDCD